MCVCVCGRMYCLRERVCVCVRARSVCDCKLVHVCMQAWTRGEWGREGGREKVCVYVCVREKGHTF